MTEDSVLPVGLPVIWRLGNGKAAIVAEITYRVLLADGTLHDVHRGDVEPVARTDTPERTKP